MLLALVVFLAMWGTIAGLCGDEAEAAGQARDLGAVADHRRGATIGFIAISMYLPLFSRYDAIR